MHKATSTPTVLNPISSIPNETYYTISLGKQAGQMSIIIKYQVDSKRWRFVDISAGITFLINPDTNSIDFPQQAHDKAIEIFSNELQKFVSQKFFHGCEKDSHTTITLKQPKLIGDHKMENTNSLPMIQQTNNKVVMTTVEVAEQTGKRHDHVLRDTETILTELYGKADLPKFGEMYLDAYGRKQKCYALPKIELLTLVSGYSISMRAKIIRRLEELEILKQQGMLSQSSIIELESKITKQIMATLDQKMGGKMDILIKMLKTRAIPRKPRTPRPLMTLEEKITKCLKKSKSKGMTIREMQQSPCKNALAQNIRERLEIMIAEGSVVKSEGRIRGQKIILYYSPEYK